MLTFAFTDTHGCLAMLLLLVSRCERFAVECKRLAEEAGRDWVEPTWVFCGDYVDRGPDSAGMIAFLREFETEHRCVFLRGNHDQMFIDAMLREDPLNWINNDMRACAQSYGYTVVDVQDTIDLMREDERVLDDCRWLDTLKFYFEDEHRIFVHAGIAPGVPMEQQDVFDLIWIREEFLFSKLEFPKWIVHGHTAHRGHPNYLVPNRTNNRTNLDTGAAYYGVMTAGVFLDVFPQPIGFLEVNRLDVHMAEQGRTSDAVPTLRQ